METSELVIYALCLVVFVAILFSFMTPRNELNEGVEKFDKMKDSDFDDYFLVELDDEDEDYDEYDGDYDGNG